MNSRSPICRLVSPSTVSRTTSLSVGVSESQPLSARRWAARLPRRSPHDADREINRWLGPLVVLMIFGFTSIAVVNTLAMIALRRRRELGLLGLVGATRRQVRSMARWAAVLRRNRPGSRPGNRGDRAAAAQPRAHGQPAAVRADRQARRDPGCLGAGGAGGATRQALRSRPVEAIGVGE